MRTPFSDSHDHRTAGNMKALFAQKTLYSSIPVLPDGGVSRPCRPWQNRWAAAPLSRRQSCRLPPKSRGASSNPS